MKNQTRVLFCCFIIFGFYVFCTFVRDEENINFEMGYAQKSNDVKERRKYRKELLLKSNSEEKIHRTPDAIVIGAGKCGTSTLRDFMDHHPLVRCFTGEPHYFDHDFDKGIEYYKKLLPPVSRHEILMEKTPGYFSSSQSDIPDKINRECPGVKLILILCNPVDRLYSSNAMIYIKSQPNKYRSTKIDPNVVNNLFEENVARKLLPYFNGKMNRNTDELFCSEEYSKLLYACKIKRWIKIFGPKRILIVDGEELLQNPGSVINEVQDYLHLPRVLRKSDFVRNPVSGMFCVRPWWEENYNFKAEKLKKGSWYENLACMWNGKGVTKSNSSKYVMKKSIRLKLQKLFRPYNERLFTLLNRTFNW